MIVYLGLVQSTTTYFSIKAAKCGLGAIVI